MDPMDAIRATFFEECAELLESLEGGLLALQSGTQTPDTVDAVFRAVHSIKGGAGAFNLSTLVAYAHEFETTLDALRSGRLTASAEVVGTLLRASDVLGDLVNSACLGEDVDVPDTSELKAVAGSAEATPGKEDDSDFNPVMLNFGLDPIPDDDIDLAPTPIEIETVPVSTSTAAPHSAVGKRIWRVTFEPLPELLVSGNEPLFLFRALEVLGRMSVEALDSDLASLSDMDVSVPRLRWSIRLEPTATDLTETEIESVFEFADDICVLTISQIKDEDENAPSPQAEAVPGQVSPAVVEPPKMTIKETADTAPPPAAPKPDVSVQPTPIGTAAPQAQTSAPATIRVDLNRVDRLVNLVGELVISQSMLAQGMTRAGLDQHSEAVATLDELQQLTRDMQDSVMSIRAQPVKSLFQRMTRIVREAGQATGKDVRLVTEGEGTEIDKTVVERLADPLTHMIRNSIDHGLEAPDERNAAGKSPGGVVRLSARQQSDRVVIEVSDDGRGINRAKVLERAIARGLVPEGKTLDTTEIDRLLFLPGFSTAQTVSALSGRGVGMDVVQRAIRDLNGTIAISSVEGKGTSISISLPLTLAILDGMIVRSSRQRMVIPLSAIVETQTYAAARIETLGPNQSVVRLHERFVPIVDLAGSMGFARQPTDDLVEDDTALLFVQPDESGTFALRVDAIEAQRQVVIKGLGENFGHIPCVSAATILGDGQVALIVDPGGIAEMAGLNRQNPTLQTPELAVQ
ncbi:chemotaxis protein CheA [Jannaschia pohangensis]|uniref:Chemotaxis protein CheA n=1 Tax=Jannaschia pohangensis TaxID=390807 RepID=A0A1I3H4N4_9RHOB|nr:chemotaxis protein CheA [Jannaschia pohangensis]SFI30520.1 two-component system, chemotaxis family, sensor kinase CheA [Jannaschia pohangensis]